MKKSELKSLIKEELLREGAVDPATYKYVKPSGQLINRTGGIIDRSALPMLKKAVFSISSDMAEDGADTETITEYIMFWVLRQVNLWEKSNHAERTSVSTEKP